MANSRHTPDRTRFVLRRATVLLGAFALGALALLALVMPSALAHDELLATSPTDGASVPVAPGSVTLEFGGEVLALGTEVLVTGPDGSPASDGTVEIVDGTVLAPLRADLPAGTYDVRWRATSSDGHPLSGEFGFTVVQGTAPAAPSPTSAREPDVAPEPAQGDRPAGSSPSVGWLAAGALLVTAGGLGVRRLRGRR